jgi:glycyl-radical enzyme activating protein family
MNGFLFKLQKGCIQDGPGIRTTVFLNGCPLNCIWCHNPESISKKPQLAYREEQCTNCKKCVDSCPNGCHTVLDGLHVFHRQNCTACGTCCKDSCRALERIGKEISSDDLLKEVLKDRAFYDSSGGGVTLSGGEPTEQFDFTFDLLHKAKENGLHTCLETCGFCKTEKLIKLAKVVDLFLFDEKETDAKRHKAFTGVSNELILNNLFELDRLGAKIILRCPIVPTLNDRSDHFYEIAQLANRLSGIQEINIEPYHPMGKEKCKELGRIDALPDLTFPSESLLLKWCDEVQKNTSKPVISI